MTIDAKQLSSLERPAQYLGGELNSIVKDDSTVDVRLALAFPDTYEVGMSHLGIQILYELANSVEYAWAERAYMPLPDMEEWLRSTKTSLFSLESKRPVREFDILGFSLQYELCGTNILGMLDLAHIPFYADQRSDEDPIVIGGGPYSYHPEPLAPFFDVFFLGDAEEFLPELLAEVRDSKQRCGRFSRADIISSLRGRSGIYIPSDFRPNYNADGTLSELTIHESSPSTIVRRLLPTLVDAPFPKKPVVPNTKTVHNRLSLEVMRGCVRGCRFCQAGYLYRPQRERSPQEIRSLIEEILPNTGYEEVSLLSLSTADYCSVVPLLRSLMDEYGDGEKLSISFPSTRVDALTPEVLEQVQRVRRTNFTIAPEGGSQRLRDVINKGVSDDQILETCSNVFRMGWTGIKLYFMLGLPTETDEDLLGIVDIAKRIKALPEGRNKEITVSVSTHVPKPHTPFQWAAQITPSETIRKQRLLASGLAKTGINFRYHDSYSSFLEGIFCRGGRELAPVIEKAYRLGARLDAWQEHLSEEIWGAAFAAFDINPYFYLRERSLDETLPWDHLSCGIPKSYFAKEYRRCLRDKTTPDCLTTSCSVCGACNYDTEKNILWPRSEAEEWYSELEATTGNTVDPVDSIRFRIRFSKTGVFAVLGYLELVSVIHRAVRRASLPVLYSQGFHPKPRISFGPPLQLGISSDSEYFDIMLEPGIAEDELIQRLNAALPNELRVENVARIDRNAPSLSESIGAMRFAVTFDEIPADALVSKSIEEILNATITRVPPKQKAKRKKKKSTKQFLLSNFLTDVTIKEHSLEYTLNFHEQAASPKPLEIVEKLTGLSLAYYAIQKTDTIFR